MSGDLSDDASAALRALAKEKLAAGLTPDEVRLVVMIIVEEAFEDATAEFKSSQRRAMKGRSIN